MANPKDYINSKLSELFKNQKLKLTPEQMTMFNNGKIPYADFLNAPLSKPKALASAVENVVKEHPWQSAGYAALGAANLGGLFDDNKVLGQILGAAGGGLGGYVLGSSPKTAILSALIGGGLGSLFDKLRNNEYNNYKY